jgi:hypothetical protein
MNRRPQWPCQVCGYPHDLASPPSYPTYWRRRQIKFGGQALLIDYLILT